MIQKNIAASDELGSRLAGLFDGAAKDFALARELGAYLGVKRTGEGQGRFVFWTPAAVNHSEPTAAEIFLAVYRPQESQNYPGTTRTVVFRRTLIPLESRAEFSYALIDGLRFGNRNAVGDLYDLVFVYPDGTVRHEPDPLAWSVPYGAAAPGELYDVEAMFEGRADGDHFSENLLDGTRRIIAPATMLEIHPGTASPDGSFAGLTEIYRQISERLEAGTDLEPWQRGYTGYDAIQLMPIEPTIGYEGGPAYWSPGTPDETGRVEVAIRAPDAINWGYDSLIAGSPAPQPSYLRSGRPHELLELIECLHAVPGGGIKVVLDVVYGHLDNQSLDCMNPGYFAGPNMYGQDFRYRDPMVRTMILEMLRRKALYGIDGIRVDGAQDFKFWDEQRQQLLHDDELLALINEVEVTAGNLKYKPWMIFEDGRPWPREDWELASSYREITKRLANVYQWGPLTFAHNTPFLFTFWISKWWRIREVAKYGGRWITGTSNHDTLRRGTQVDPGARINTYLGEDLPEIFRRGYDSPAGHLFDTIMPGIPMDFLQANLRVPWSFIRNTDRKWGPKVMAEESAFLDWTLRDDEYTHEWVFPRLKELGFLSLVDLKTFVRALGNTLAICNFDAAAAAELMNNIRPKPAGPAVLDAEVLVQIARRWMEDVRDLCSVHRWRDKADAEALGFAENLRAVRRSHRWLMESMTGGDQLKRLEEAEGAVVFAVYRRDPATGDAALMVANMEGTEKAVELERLPFSAEIMSDIAGGKWRLGSASPGVAARPMPDGVIELANGQGILWLQ
jgi:hypothetical protein